MAGAYFSKYLAIQESMLSDGTQQNESSPMR